MKAMMPMPFTRRKRHPEDYCHRCGGPNIIWYAPSPLWNEVMRGGDISGRSKWSEIICPTCFCILTQEAGIGSAFRIYATRLEVKLPTTTPDGRVWNSETWLWEEPKS
jgi:hypothetical protein